MVEVLFHGASVLPQAVRQSVLRLIVGSLGSATVAVVIQPRDDAPDRDGGPVLDLHGEIPDGLPGRIADLVGRETGHAVRGTRVGGAWQLTVESFGPAGKPRRGPRQP